MSELRFRLADGSVADLRGAALVADQLGLIGNQRLRWLASRCIAGSMGGAERGLIERSCAEPPRLVYR